MKNGDNHPGRIHLGDLNQWTFEAAKGDYITLAIGEVGADKPLFWPWIWLIGPDGKFLRDAAHALAAQIHQVAPLSGRYTVVVSSSTPGMKPPETTSSPWPGRPVTSWCRRAMRVGR